MTYEEVKDVKEKYEERLMSIKNIIKVDIGEEDSEYYIRVHAIDDVVIPSKIAGVGVRIVYINKDSIRKKLEDGEKSGFTDFNRDDILKKSKKRLNKK